MKKSETVIKIKQPLETDVVIIEKNIKSLILRYKDGRYYLSKPPYVSNQKAIEWLESLSLQQFLKLKRKTKQTSQMVYLFGKKYSLKFYDLNLKKVVVLDDEIHVYKKNYLDTYLKEVLKDYIEKRIKTLKMVPFDVDVSIQKMTSKYGCCFHTQRRVKFSSELIHEPKAIIDSVIIHELAHFYYPNHQKSFYELVRKYDKNYDQHVAFLKAGGAGDDPINK